MTIDEYKKARAAIYSRERRLRSPEKVALSKRKSYLKKEYGITIEQYDDMIDSQSYCCAICRICLAYVQNVCVDHCHKTGKVRGILCGKCNKTLGLVDESVETLQEAIRYLEEHVREDS